MSNKNLTTNYLLPFTLTKKMHLVSKKGIYGRKKIKVSQIVHLKCKVSKYVKEQDKVTFYVTLQEKWVLIADWNSVFYDCAMFDIPVSCR